MDMQIVAHAKDYIDAMAKGKHPLTGQELPEGDTLNNVRISRCLFFVSDVLEEVLANGGVGAPKKEKKQPFRVQGIDFSKMHYKETPRNISDIVNDINALRPENMSKLKVTAVTDWLVDIGMLEIVTISGKNRKQPTAKGLAMGILKEERVGLYGPYTVVLYSADAQHFIVDNLIAVIEGGYNSTKERKKSTEPAEEETILPIGEK